MLIINAALLFATLLCLYEFLSRNQLASWITYSVLPLVLLPWWIIHTDYVPFVWLKIYSVMIGASAIIAFRFTRLRKKRWIKHLLMIILLVNILEAVVQDAIAWHYINYMNASAGLLLVFMMPKSDVIMVDNQTPARNLAWDIPLPWIIGYTLWNISFVYLHWSGHVLINAIGLAAPLIIGLINNRLWMQARAFTLGIFLMITFTYQPMLEPLKLSIRFNENVGLAGASISFAWMVFYGLYLGRTWLQPSNVDNHQKPASRA